MGTAREVAEKMRKKTQNNKEDKPSITAREAAEKLLKGSQSTSTNKTPTFDYETGKKGWEKYLADKESTRQQLTIKQETEKKEDKTWWEKFLDFIGECYGPTGPADTTLPLGNTSQIINDVRNDTI